MINQGNVKQNMCIANNLCGFKNDLQETFAIDVDQRGK